MTQLHEKIQNSLNESRILILGSEILLGFQYRSFFEAGFKEIPFHSKLLDSLALMLILITVGCVTSPAMYHRIVFRGEDTSRLQNYASTMMMVALIPFAFVIGIDLFIAAEKVAGTSAGLLIGVLTILLALFWWYGIQGLIRFRQKPSPGKSFPENLPEEKEPTPLEHKIRHVLTETRVMLPGAQALLAFQLTIVLMEEFKKLTQNLKTLHLICLGLIVLAVMMLMSPAAYHQIVDRGEETESFHRFASRMIVASGIPLGLALSGDLFIVAMKVTQSLIVSGSGAVATLALFLGSGSASPPFAANRRIHRKRPDPPIKAASKSHHRAALFRKRAVMAMVAYR